jgi:hypothetical protein
MRTGAYSVGVPQRFVTNFEASQRFLESLETLCSSTRAVAVFRGSAAYRSWQDRWKLSVYYGLCFQVSTAATLFSPIGYARCEMHVRKITLLVRILPGVYTQASLVSESSHGSVVFR